MPQHEMLYTKHDFGFVVTDIAGEPITQVFFIEASSYAEAREEAKRLYERWGYRGNGVLRRAL